MRFLRKLLKHAMIHPPAQQNLTNAEHERRNHTSISSQEASTGSASAMAEDAFNKALNSTHLQQHKGKNNKQIELKTFDTHPKMRNSNTDQ
jgi:hypothetical protein